MDSLIIVLFLAGLIEWVTERFFGFWLQGKGMVFISAGLGVALSLVLSVDALALTGVKLSYHPAVGQALTGIIIGGGANTVHKFLKPSEKNGPSNGETKGGATA